MVEHPGAAGLGEELGAEADERPGGDDVVEAHPAGSVVDHVDHARPTLAEELCDGADVFLRDVDREALGGLVDFAVDLSQDDGRLADGELEALAAHGLYQNG